MNEKLLIRDTPVDTLLNAKNLTYVLKAIFKDAELHTSVVNKGGTSGNIYVPKRLVGRLATIIVWDNKNETTEKVN